MTASRCNAAGAMRGLHHFQTLIAAEDRLYVAADGAIYAFALPRELRALATLDLFSS